MASPFAPAEQDDVLPPASPRRRRRWRFALFGAAAVAVLTLVGGGLLAWSYSSTILVPDHGWDSSVEIDSVTPGRIVLTRSDESERPGIYGLVWRGGNAILGPVLKGDADTVTRRLSHVNGFLVPGVDADIDTDVFEGDPRSTLGLPFEEIEVRGELGPMPAWLIPPSGRPSGAWAIVVHGLNGTRREGLRVADPLRALGVTSMLMSYRGDLGSPPSPDGLHHLGQTEWHDLQASVRYALAHGAKRLILFGYSMGGAIITQFMEKSHLAGRVSALVLDSPVLDWRSVLEFNATETGFPAIAANPLEWAVDARVGADWDSLDALSHTEDLRVPILLFQADNDERVPASDSDELATELPRTVTYYRVPQAGHTQEWNVEPRRFNRRLQAFLRSHDFDESPVESKKRARPLGSGSE